LTATGENYKGFKTKSLQKDKLQKGVLMKKFRITYSVDTHQITYTSSIIVQADNLIQASDMARTEGENIAHVKHVTVTLKDISQIE
jgi:hypothetical protein